MKPPRQSRDQRGCQPSPKPTHSVCALSADRILRPLRTAMPGLFHPDSTHKLLTYRALRRTEVQHCLQSLASLAVSLDRRAAEPSTSKDYSLCKADAARAIPTAPYPHGYFPLGALPFTAVGSASRPLLSRAWKAMRPKPPSQPHLRVSPGGEPVARSFTRK